MTISNTRYKKLIQEIPKHKTAKDAIIASGFSENTANKQAKRVLNSALKHQAKEILETPDTTLTSKRLMSEIVGLSSEVLFERLRNIATQEKDLSSALKVLAPLSREHGVTLQADEAQSVTVPILNVVVEKQSPHESQEVKEIEGSVEP